MGAMPALETPLPPDKNGGQAPDLPRDFRSDDPREVRYLAWTIRDALRGTPTGPVEVVLTLRRPEEGPRRDWDKLYGLGKEVWEGVDVEAYLRELREDREGPP